MKIPIVAVLGNHDFEADEDDEIARILADVGVHMLDGDAWEFQGRRLRRRAGILRADSVAGRSARGARRSSRTSCTRRCRKRSSSSPLSPA